MTFDREKFKTAYEKWVTESLPEYEAGRMTEIVKRYPFVVSDDVPWTPYRGQPSEQTFALVTSGGLFLKDSQPAFDTVSIHGDPSLREIPKNVKQADIGFAHAHYDHSLAEKDLNIIFPIHRLVELEQEGIIGRVADTNYSFSYVNDVATLVDQTIPAFISRIKADKVDVVLLVPV
ncbi:MAG: glycine/sarcosine/betaine reductase selenoprotein B family protein [Desulfobacterales bacterium]